MTETALRDRETSAAGAWLMRGLPTPLRGQAQTEVLAPAAPEPERPAPAAGQRNWSSALDLIHEATAAIRIAEERASELEQELERTVAQALERARLLEAQIASAQNRADAAEKRAAEAEDWLARLHDAVVAGFTRPAAEPAPPAAA